MIQPGFKPGTDIGNCSNIDGSIEIGHHDSTQMDRNGSTMTDQRSPLVELLVYPTPTQKTSTAKSCARVLTSADSIAMFKEKVSKKEA